MSPKVHALASVGGGLLLWQLLHSWQAGLASALAGFFMDLDHLVDYVIAGQRSLRLQDFLGFYRHFNEKHIWVPFHGWEAVPVLLLLAWWGIWPAWLIGLAFGLAHHLALDQWGNGLHPAAYCLSYRVAVGFKCSKIMRHGLEAHS